MGELGECAGGEIAGVKLLQLHIVKADDQRLVGVVIQGDAGTLRGEGSVSTLSKIFFEDNTGSNILAEFDGKIKLSYELTEFIRQYEANDYGSCYQMLDHSVAVTEVVDQLLDI